MGKHKHILLLGLILVVALATSLTVYNWFQQKAKKEKKEIVQVVVASTDLTWGTQMRPGMIKTAPFFRTSLAPGHFVDLKSVEGRVLIAPLKENEPILESKLAPVDVTRGGVAAVITPSKRAMAVKVDKEKGVSGFIHPGNRVDVLVSIKRNMNAPTTKMVLENILVLTVGTDIESSGSPEKPSQVDVITLEVTPEEAERLALATTEGKIQLALRNFVDNDTVKTSGVTIPVLLGAERPQTRKERVQTRTVYVEKKVNVPVPVKASFNTVEVVRGGNSEKIQFKGGE